jgi:eukaryotic-like serine/threonine-protein kinase
MPQEHPAEDTIDAFVRGRLPESHRAHLEHHLDGCPGCREIVVRVLSQMPEPVAETLRGSLGAWVPTGAARSELAEGDRVGRHIVIGRLGAGGMGTVYAAYDTTLDRKIALKFISGSHVDPAAAARLVGEATAMARLSHPNVVTVHDVGMMDGHPFLAMEYVEGQTLGEWRRAAPRSVRQVLDVMAAVARGLEAAHAAGIVHRDVKPHNILVAGSRVLVTDFGLSVRVGGGEAGAVAGTPGYMAPEQFRGEAATRATDVFGFSVTLYEMLYDRLPFQGGSMSRIAAAVMAGQVQPPPAGASRVPGRVHRLVLAGLAVDPAARPANMGAIAEALLADPARRARRAGAGAIAAGAVVAAFWGGGYLKTDPERRCQAGAAVIDGAWGEPRRQALERRYRAAGKESTGAAVARRLADYAGAWRSMYGATCTAAYADRRISGELLDLRLQCLTGHRATFEALLAATDTATPAQLVKVAGAPLPPVAECDLTERPSTRPLPADPAVRQRVAEVTARLGQADAQNLLGDQARARRLATDAVAAARKLAYEPLLARALMVLAAVERRAATVAAEQPAPPPAATAVAAGGAPATGPERAVKLLQEAVAMAETGRDDALRAEAARELAVAHRDGGRPPEAGRWAKLASSMVTRIGDPPTYRAALDQVQGRLHLDAGDRKRARASFERALALRRRVLGPRALETVASASDLCRVEEDRARRAACLRQAITEASAVVGARHPEVALLGVELAAALRDDARTRAEACAVLKDGLAIFEGALDPGDTAVIAAIDRLAVCLADEGKNEEALKLYLDAGQRAAAASGPRGDLRQSFGAFLASHGDLDGAVRELRGAATDREALHGPAHETALASHLAAAEALRAAGRLREALDEIDATLAAVEKGGATAPSYLALHELRGDLLRKSNRLPDATRAYEQALALHEKLGTPESARKPALLALGALERQSGRLDPAITHLEKAVALHPAGETPRAHAQATFELAQALASARGRAGAAARACALAHEARAGFGGASPEGPAVRRFLASRRCGDQTAAPKVR